MMLFSAARVASRIASLDCSSRTWDTAAGTPRVSETTGFGCAPSRPIGATCRVATRRPVSAAGRHQCTPPASGAAHSPAPDAALDAPPKAEVDAPAGRMNEGAMPRLPCLT
eukprot:5200900-Prymnesium_polylepis.1